jgi:hypothetical protein
MLSPSFRRSSFSPSRAKYARGKSAAFAAADEAFKAAMRAGRSLKFVRMLGFPCSDLTGFSVLHRYPNVFHDKAYRDLMLGFIQLGNRRGYYVRGCEQNCSRRVVATGEQLDEIVL